ncbi:NAD(P)-dependent oxidoreductase [Sulfitobacter sp. S190]|uniref:NAD-dependent epimerase/dehydratase family protein n=1 Tax=Sulfitobacter sp. S190 TaxID=2867022 RepID=UPI0021A76258|nr:NAD-dependent epimerase/dehydratase family protein [Sulfitobacter sp. S190]UWR22566.1 sugar nucleotide-binding protein [Sulfitobacter sp. S190]
MASITTSPSDRISDPVLLGGSGRLARMLRAHWPGALSVQSRGGAPGTRRIDPLADPEGLAAFVRGKGDIICMAGVTPAHAAATDDALSLNSDLALAAIAAAGPGQRVFVMSSAAVYGRSDAAHKETDTPQPLSEYGAAKMQMERVALARGGPRVCVLRIGNVVGADAIVGGWAPGMTLHVTPDGQTLTRSYIGPVGLARCLHALTQVPELPDILNVTAPVPVRMGDLLDAAGMAWSPLPAPAGAIANVTLDHRRLSQYVQFDPAASTARDMIAQWREGTDTA